MQDWFTVLIPTKDSAAWIGALLSHYQARGVTPTLLLDDRTTDATRAIAERAGAPVVDIHGFTHTEAIVSVARDFVRTPWALMVHDDEVPSEKLFARLAGPPPPDAADTVAVPRRWAWYVPGQPLQYGRSAQWQDRTGQHGNDHHWRMFRPERVIYTPTMHWDGYFIDRWSRVPLDHYIIHFEWVLRSHMQRMAKIRRYDEHRWGYGKFFEKLYLPESQAPGVIEYLPFETDAYDRLAETYFAARAAGAVLPRRSLRWRLETVKHWIAGRIFKPNFSRDAADRAGLHVKPECEIEDLFNVL